LCFVFGPARDTEEIDTIRERYLVPGGFESAQTAYRDFLSPAKGCLEVATPNRHFDQFVNQWLPRQVYYHGSANRLTLDAQTRNYLQDNMGMAFIDPAVSRDALRKALAQQLDDGNMPEGILLRSGVALKYINQVPHTDHCIWLPVCLQAYLDETGDDAFLSEVIRDDRQQAATVFERVTNALRWQSAARDARGLSLIAQGDWCDPMNMVGPAGRGVSGWLSIALVHALQIWCALSRRMHYDDVAEEFDAVVAELRDAIDEHLWDGAWYARGITDSGRRFGTDADQEGRVYLNPQSWALLANVASSEQRQKLLAAVQQQLETPYGAALLAPAYTQMREDIGRVTQKFPGTAENGAIYNHAAAFYIAALYEIGESERAFEQLMRAIPGPESADYLRRGQLPVFVPNYYRGAVQQFPRTAGRSSQLFNTGAASWLYRIVIEQLFGLRGCAEGLGVRPQLPAHWNRANVERSFRGAHINFRFRRDPGHAHVALQCPEADIRNNVISGLEPGRRYIVQVQVPVAVNESKPKNKEHIL
jgi:cellobionic acid phosphorylase